MTTFILPKSVFRNLAILLLSLWSYTAIAQNFIEVDKLIASDRGAVDLFGMYAVAVDGNYAFVGAKFEDDDAAGNNPKQNAGSVYIYKRDASGNWVEVQKIVASDRQEQDQFGISVSVSGDYAVIGALHGEGDSTSTSFQAFTGSAYVFKLMPTGLWVEIQEIVSADRELYDNFGCSVSISGKNIIVGARGEDHDLNNGNRINYSGSAYLFEQTVNGLWVQQQKIVASQRVYDGYYGASVSISGNYAVVGAYYEKSSGGSAYIIERDVNGLWVETKRITPANGSGMMYFGFSVSISGNYLIVGSHFSLYNSSAAFLFERSTNGNWIQKQKIVPSDRGPWDRFGISVSISGNKAIVGAYGSNLNTLGLDSLMEAGSAYVFRRTWNGLWQEEQKIVASDRAIRNLFGHAVAISKDYAIVGSINEQDLNGNNTMYRAGAAYMYENPPCLNSAFSFSVIECERYTVPSSNATYSNVGNYTVIDTVPNHCGGDSVLTIDLTILPPKTSSVTSTICNNDSMVVNGTVYHSDNPSGTEVIPNVGPYNCDSTITVNLNVLEAKIDNLSEILCNGDSVVVNGTIYNSGNLSGTENFTGIGPFNCDSLVIIDLKLYTPLKMQPLVIGEVCVNEQVEVFADIQGGKPPYSFFWSFEDVENSFVNFRFTPNRIVDGFVFFKVSDACKEADSTEISIYISDCELVIPNVFTPNGDGVHEYFYIKGLQHYASNNLQVYNRWGVLIFNQFNYRNTWDGYDSPAGVYYYILETTKKGQLNTHKGNVTLFK